MSTPMTPARTYLGTRADSGRTRYSRSDCQREHADHRDGEGAMLCPVTPETLTREQIALWYDGTEKHFRHQLTMWVALGESAGPCYRKPTTEETAEARQRICDAINARRDVI